MPKTIIDAFKEFNGQLIILISGLSGSGKSKLGDNIAQDFKLEHIDTKKFYKQNYNNTSELANGKKVVNYETDDAFDWNAMNKEINDKKKNGIVVSGHAFPTDKLDFIQDYHIHLKISKQKLKQNRIEYIEKHPEKSYDSESETLRINSISYPYYLTILKRMKMDKFLETSELSSDEIYDAVFDEIIKYIENNIHDDRYKKKNKNVHDVDEYTSDYVEDVTGEPNKKVYNYKNEYFMTYTINDD